MPLPGERQKERSTKMKLDKVLGARRRVISYPDPARHARKCSICRHKSRPQIDTDFLSWRSTREIVRQYALPHRVYLYRHAQATGLTRRRKGNVCSILDSMIEQVASVPITGSTILRAIRAYSCLKTDGDWVEPTTRVIFRRYKHPAPPASSLQRREALAAAGRPSRTDRQGERPNDHRSSVRFSSPQPPALGLQNPNRYSGIKKCANPMKTRTKPNS
jgi:hypothetical protein